MGGKTPGERKERQAMAGSNRKEGYTRKKAGKNPQGGEGKKKVLIAVFSWRKREKVKFCSYHRTRPN